MDYEEITINLTLEKTYCVNIPEDKTKDEYLEDIKNTIMTPMDEIEYLLGIIKKLGISVAGIDPKEWNVNNITVK
jgi:hypothetical protein